MDPIIGFVEFTEFSELIDSDSYIGKTRMGFQLAFLLDKSVIGVAPEVSLSCKYSRVQDQIRVIGHSI